MSQYQNLVAKNVANRNGVSTSTFDSERLTIIILVDAVCHTNVISRSK